MTKRKINLSRIYAKARRLPIRLIIIIIIFLSVCFIIKSLGKTLKTLDYFRVKDIVIKGIDNVDLSYLKGLDIFAVSLQRESRYK